MRPTDILDFDGLLALSPFLPFGMIFHPILPLSKPCPSFKVQVGCCTEEHLLAHTGNTKSKLTKSLCGAGPVPRAHSVLTHLILITAYEGVILPMRKLRSSELMSRAHGHRGRKQ